jgi:hypothetical protein
MLCSPTRIRLLGVSFMIGEHPSFKHPSNHDVKLWRYMDLAKFVSLLLTRSLYLPRADRLGDPFEGSITKVQYEMRDYIRKYRNIDPRLVDWRSFSEAELEALFASQATMGKKNLSECFVSCWHMNEHESAAMWRLYSQSSEAVCVQSTFKKLAEAFPSYTFAGEVHYIDYEIGNIPSGIIFEPLLYKRMSFSHERELRALAWSPISSALGGDEIRRNMTEYGLPIGVDLEKLVESIYVSPTSAAWFREIVTALVASQGLKLPVHQSNLSATPLF